VRHHHHVVVFDIIYKYEHNHNRGGLDDNFGNRIHDHERVPAIYDDDCGVDHNDLSTLSNDHARAMFPDLRGRVLRDHHNRSLGYHNAE
jgi:hypothetical protein